MEHIKQPTDNSADSQYKEFTEGLEFDFDYIWSTVVERVNSFYASFTDTVDDEFHAPVNQKQLNEALYKFVTKNVKQIHELRIELHDGWFRLFCTVEALGIYAEVASNFRLVHAQIDRDVQRFVFDQQTNTDVLNLRCDSFLKRQGVKLFIWFYHSVLHKDPLGFILNKINIAKPKENIIYLDIHRWLKKNKKIMSTLRKVQVNYGVVEEQQLVLKAQVNVRELFNNTSGEDIITSEDKPEVVEKSVQPVSNIINPSYEAG